MFDHKEEDVWKAIKLDERKVLDKLKSIATQCTKEKKLPSEKIEMLSKEFNPVELSAIILMLEFRIHNILLYQTNTVMTGYA